MTLNYLNMNGEMILFDRRVHIPFYVQAPEACNEEWPALAEIIPFPKRNDNGE